MARTVVIGNQTYKQRNILGVWLGLPLITFGIYHLFWYYKINDEARRYLGDESIHPLTSLIAILFGGFLILPPFISNYNTGKRIQRMQAQAGVTGQIEPILCVLLMFVFGLNSLYMQSHLNKVWALSLSPAVPAPQPA